MTLESNKRIAEFMGCVEDGEYMRRVTKYYDFPFPDDGIRCHSETMKYHYSWDWIMPVVKKIGELGEGYPSEELSEALLSADIKLVYSQVLEFLEWHYQPNTPPPAKGV